MRVFDQARAIAAADIARQAGLRLTRRGGREWTCCPFHKEKTASCMFDSSGRFHCFGCGADGDSIDFYSRLHGVDKLTAARELTGDRSIPRTAHIVRHWKPKFLDEPDDEGFSWDFLCTLYHSAGIAMYQSKPDSTEFWKMLAIRSDSFCKLENLLAGEEIKSLEVS